MKNRCVSRRFLGIFCLALTICWGMHSAYAYQTLNNDRLLLLNNDTSKVVDAANHKLSITLQGYYDQDATANYYWSHVGRGNANFRPYQAGTDHTMYAKDGTVLWQLLNCRFGTAVYRNLNYLPTSSTAQASVKGSSSVDPSATVIMQNVIDSQVVSPYYNQDGVGTVYFDVVNLFGTGSAPEDPCIAFEVSTGLRSDVEGSFETVTNPNDMEWVRMPFDVLVVENGAISQTRFGQTNLVLQAGDSQHDAYYYRVRARLDHREPMRFRIVRCNIDETPGTVVDAVGTILIDNIQVSYPPMSAELIKNEV